MKKLDDIPKKNPFEVPDGYFEQLPSRVQARISARQPRPFVPFWGRALRYALPVILLTTIGIFWYRDNTTVYVAGTDIETELEGIQPGQLAVYLDDRDLTTDDLIETVTWSPEDIQALETSVYSAIEVSDDEIEKLIEEYDEP